MTSTFFQTLGSALDDFFSPLMEALDDPDLLASFLDELGSSPDDQACASLVSALQPIVNFVQTIESMLGKSSPGFSDIATLLEAANQAFLAIHTLDTSSDLAAKFGGLGKDLLDLLLGMYMGRNAPLMYRILVLLTVIDAPEEVVATDPVVSNGAAIRGPVSIPRFRPDRLVALVQEPVKLLKAYYLNALQTDDDAAAMADKLFPRFVSILTYLGVANKYGLLPDEQTRLGDAAAYMEHALTVWLAEQLAGASADAGFHFAISPAQRGNLGLVISPFGDVEYTAQDGNLNYKLDFSAQVDAIGIGPKGTVITASVATTTVSGTFTITLATPDGEGAASGGSGGTTSPPSTTPAMATPAFVLGPPAGTRLEVGGGKFEVDLSVSGGDFSAGISAEVSKAAIVISGGDGDGFLQSILPSGGLRTNFDLGVAWSNTAGVAFHGAAGLDAALPIGISIADIIKIPTLYLGIRAADGQLSAEASLQITTTIGPVSATIDHLGMASVVTFLPGGGNLGIADLNYAFQPPTGVGLSVDAAGVSGGGFLGFSKPNHEYSGVLQLKFNDIELQAFGLITTQLASGPGYSLLALVDANFPPIQLGWGFTLNGVGGLLAIHRSASVDALRAAIKAGKLTFLFPKNAITNASQILAQLDTLFPTAPGRFLFGPMARIGWGTPTLLTASVAVILELPEPIRIVLLANIEARLPDPSEPLVRLNIDALGVLDLSRDELSLDASLFDSKLITYSISGDMALRATWSSQREFLLAVGGFHPQFTPPADFPALKRVTIDMPSGIVSKLRLAAYLALTSNSVQFGATLDVFIGVSGCGLTGHLGFDALLQLDPFHFSADISGSVAITADGDDLASVSLKATLTGPAPWNIAGSFSIHLLFFDVGVSFSQSWGLSAPAEQPSTIDVGALLGTALADPRNWNSQLPAGLASLVTTRQVEDPTAIFAHPLALLEVHEQVVPLGLAITRFGEAVPSGVTTFSITDFRVGSQTTAYSAVEDDFAPAQFFDLSDAEKLSRPSFERHDAGAIMSGNLVTNGSLVPKTINYETSFIDTPGVVRPGDGVAHPFPWGDLPIVMRTGSAAQKAISRVGGLRFTNPGKPIRVAAPAFALADTVSLAAQAATPVGKTTYSDVLAALAATVAATPARKGTLQVIGTHELARAA
jgi:hypothetical protein